jgi:hypothetical protein
LTVLTPTYVRKSEQCLSSAMGGKLNLQSYKMTVFRGNLQFRACGFMTLRVRRGIFSHGAVSFS